MPQYVAAQKWVPGTFVPRNENFILYREIKISFLTSKTSFYTIEKFDFSCI